jgi:hypothetical protein
MNLIVAYVLAQSKWERQESVPQESEPRVIGTFTKKCAFGFRVRAFLYDPKSEFVKKRGVPGSPPGVLRPTHRVY